MRTREKLLKNKLSWQNILFQICISGEVVLQDNCTYVLVLLSISKPYHYNSRKNKSLCHGGDLILNFSSENIYKLMMKSVDCVLNCAHWSLKLTKIVQITVRSLDLFFCFLSNTICSRIWLNFLQGERSRKGPPFGVFLLSGSTEHTHKKNNRNATDLSMLVSVSSYHCSDSW